MQILFPNSHPVVEEDVERLKSIAATTSKHKRFNLDWEEEPEERHPKWLKKHWAMMQELKAGSLQKQKHHLFFFTSQKHISRSYDFCALHWLSITREGESTRFTTIARKPSSSSEPTSSTCLGYLQHCWRFWIHFHQYKSEYWSYGIWLQWWCDTLHYSEWWFLLYATQEVYYRPGSKICLL